MYCKNCGNPIDKNSKFCASCGAPIDGKRKQNDVPHQFKESYHGIDESQKGGMMYEKSGFKGKSVGYSSSGSISFNKKKRGFLGKLIRFGVIVVVAVIALSFLFGNDELIVDLKTSDVINYETFEPVGPTDLFDDSIGVVFATFATNGVEIGQTVRVEFYLEDTLLDYGTYVTQGEFEQMAFQLPRPTSGWVIGAVYRVEVFVDGEFVTSTTYTFEQ